MAVLDIILLICFIPALVQGVRKGFVDQVISLAVVIVGIWMSFKFSSAASGWIQPYMSLSPAMLQIISFVVIFIIVAIVLNLLGKAAESLLKAATLGWFNRLLGFVFALAKAALVIGTLVIIFDTLNEKFNFVAEETLAESVLYNPIKDLTLKVFPFFKSLIK